MTHRMAGLVIILALVSMAPKVVYSHGITRQIKTGKAMVVSALYDDGEPISYASIKVYAPGDTQVEFQNGRTDKNGRFAFVPTEAGDWLVRLDDGTGHGFEEHVSVGEDMSGGASAPVLVKLGQKIIVFLLIAWGGTMTALYARRKKTS